ncbi:MAG: DUF3793 family protein [Lachnospiraceae bacterium]|nr:DUF3793 family protein [Lachnospiraceae bacterium]
MTEEVVIENCSPTLAGIKTGNMFTVRVNGNTDVYGEVRELNKVLRAKGLKAVPLKKTPSFAVIYIYRPDYLRNDFKHPKAKSILSKRGYDCSNPDGCVAQLARHMKEDESFPHEVGLFLGYPPFDVECFMKNPHDGVKCCGYWKAYSDPEAAKEKFTKFKKCTETYRIMNKQGKSLAQLAVVTDRNMAG